MPAFYPAAADVPRELRTAECVLLPLRAAHNALDYDAVMASREHLLVTSEGRWPHAGFCAEENLADLVEHEREFVAREAFAYTVLDAQEQQCLGCVYITPLERMLRHYGALPEELAEVGDYEAEAHFWVRTSRQSDDLDRRLLAALLPWLRERFTFRRVVLGAQANDERMMALLRDAGLEEVARYPTPTTWRVLFA